MKKKSNQTSSMKIPKSSSSNSHDKRHLNNLIKILKPKVYITDSSNFKHLVQQLTGNTNTNDHNSPDNNHADISNPSYISTSPTPSNEQVFPTMELIEESKALEFSSFDSSSSEGSSPPISSSFTPLFDVSSSPENEYLYFPQLPSLGDDNKVMDCAYGEIESLLFDDDSYMIPCNDNNNYEGHHDPEYYPVMFDDQQLLQEVCVYDYDLSTLI